MRRIGRINEGKSGTSPTLGVQMDLASLELGRMVSPRVLRLYVSPGHNYFGHHGRPAGEHQVVERDSVECISGRGLTGDRFFDYKPDYKGQITFFSREVFDSLCATLELGDANPAVLRRNVLVSGVDLNAWIGREFEIQGIRFLGTGECKPCYWMDSALSGGAERAMKGRGGLRAKILSSGTLRVDGA